MWTRVGRCIGPRWSRSAGIQLAFTLEIPARSQEAVSLCSFSCGGEELPSEHQNWSTDCQLDRLADTAQHFYQRIDGELGSFLIDHVGYTRARDHQNLGGLGLL
jgi:hypothetical protein